MPGFEFKLDPKFDDELVRSPELRGHLEKLAKNAADRAKQLVPVDTGDLQDSIEGVVDFDRRGFVGRVDAHDFKAKWIEFGTVRRPARPFLRPALEAEVGPLAPGADA